MRRWCKGLVLDRDAIAAGYDDWLAAPAGKKNAWRVDAEYGGRDALIDGITDGVASRSLTFRPIHRYWHWERGKLRRIGVESVKQQVVDHAAVLAMAPMLHARVGFWQCGTEGKGQEAAMRHVRSSIMPGDWWVHMDVRKCYPSMPHEVVMGILRRYVASRDLAYVAGALVGTYDEGGMEIGSYFSLRIMQLMLSFGYHHVEGLGKVRRGKRRPLVRGQCWYADDVWLWGPRKADVRSAARSLERYMSAELGLGMKPWQLHRFCGDRPVDVCGYRIFADGHVRLRQKTFLRAVRSVRRYERDGDEGSARAAISLTGRLSHCSADRWLRDHGKALGRAREAVSSADRRRNANSAVDQRDRAR